MLLKIIPLLGVLFYASGAIRGETEPCDKLLSHPTIPVVEFKGNRETLQKATATSERFITLPEFPLVLIGSSDEPHIEILNDIVVVREGPNVVCVVPFIRRQSRAYLLASITGMQGKLPVRDTWTVFLQSFGPWIPASNNFHKLENLILEYLDKLMKQLVGQAYQLSTNAGPE